MSSEFHASRLLLFEVWVDDAKGQAYLMEYDAENERGIHERWIARFYARDREHALKIFETITQTHTEDTDTGLEFTTEFDDDDELPC